MDNWGMSNGVSDNGVGNCMSDWVSNGVSNNWVVDSMGQGVGNWVSNGMGHWVGNRVGNNWMMYSMSHWVGNRDKAMSNRSTMMRLVNSMSNNSSMSMIYHMRGDIRCWGGASKTNQSRNNESLKKEKFSFKLLTANKLPSFLFYRCLTTDTI